MGTAFPFLKEKNHVVSIIGGGGKTTLLYEMAGFCVKNDQKVPVTVSSVASLVMLHCRPVLSLPTELAGIVTSTVRLSTS